MRIGLIACGHGLGHIKRLIKITNRLVSRIPDAGLTLYCEPWQVESLRDWSEFRLFHTRDNARIVSVNIPIRWSPNPDEYLGWLMEWHKGIPEWELGQFDFILSDNLVEPLLYNDNVILIGSFLWHDVFSIAFPDNPVVRQYREWAENLLRKHRTDMIVSRYFVMPAAERQTNTHKVGIIGFSETGRIERGKSSPESVLVALGSTREAEECLEQLVAATQKLSKTGIMVLCPSRWYDVLSQHTANVKIYDFNSNSLDSVDIAIIRAGMGTICDCITAGVPMLYIPERNPEIHFNQRCLSQLGIGVPLQDFLDGKPSPLSDANIYRSMLERMADFSLQGDAEAADFLTGKLGIAKPTNSRMMR